MKEEYRTTWDLFKGNVEMSAYSRVLSEYSTDLGAAQHDQGLANSWHTATDVKGLQIRTKQANLALASADVSVSSSLSALC